MNKIAIITGAGKLPTLFLEEAVDKGYEVYPIYLFDGVDNKIKEYTNSVKYSIAQVGKIIKYLKSKEISKLIMLGKVEKNLIFSNLKFDLVATKILMSTRNKKDKNIAGLIQNVRVVHKNLHFKIKDEEKYINNFIKELKIYIF